jgi:mRNA interferase MazF
MPKTLCNQADILAQHHKISRNRLFGIAIENFVNSFQDAISTTQIGGYQDAIPAAQIGEGRLAINQGDIFWVQLEDLSESEPGIRHPHVVIQDNVFNHSRITTVVACALTSNITRANTLGNVLLDAGEANLPKQSVVEVSKVSTVEKTQLRAYIGSLSDQRINQILAGMRFLQLSFFTR